MHSLYLKAQNGYRLFIVFQKKRNEFKIRIEGYLECYEKSVVADFSLKNTGIGNLRK